MKRFDFTYGTPGENLACDEALLEVCDTGCPEAMAGVLRFYESPRPFVVVGYGNRVGAEVDVEACEREGVEILRRATGGGTVLLGPGCLAYALVVPIRMAPELETVTATNRWVMERNRRAIQSVVGLPVRVQGHTDLTLSDVKFSGNAQRRKRNAVLFHGTFLLEMDLDQVGRCLRRPSVEPDYRRGRAHRDFVTNLRVAGSVVRSAMEQEWGVTGEWEGDLTEGMARLMAARYGLGDWHRRF